MIKELLGLRPRQQHSPGGLLKKNRELLAQLKNERNLRRSLEKALAALEARSDD